MLEASSEAASACVIVVRPRVRRILWHEKRAASHISDLSMSAAAVFYTWCNSTLSCVVAVHGKGPSTPW